jgi:proline iminopeptidase
VQLTRREMIVGSTLVALSACATKSPPKVSEGRITVPGGSVVWRRFGDGPKTPLILIHGGPGFPSDYLEPFDVLGDERPVYVWDQLG